MADITSDRCVQICDKIFGGYLTIVNIDDFDCTCKIIDHVVNKLTTQLEELGLSELVNLLNNAEFTIEKDLEDLKKSPESEVIWICNFSEENIL